MGILDSQSIKITCPKCRRDRSETVAKLRLNPKLTCLGCGTVLEIDARGLNTAAKDIDKSIADLKRTLGPLR